jgi:protoporphyrinogen oxidase
LVRSIVPDVVESQHRYSIPVSPKTAIIIGAGPAGLTAAYELITRSDIHPIVLERSTYMGGISRTVECKGNRMDIGGHRFFSKSDRVMNWWQAQMPIEKNGEAERIDLRMLLRARRSRIYFLRKFFEYPIQLTWDTIRKLGLWRTLSIGVSYLRSALFPIRPVNNLEEFFINRFGRELYRTFFKSYTEKVWGVPCRQIRAEWGAQRIKGLSIRKAIGHFLSQTARKTESRGQKGTETSLIDQFLYPKFGPGQMWEEVARKIVAAGGEIVTEVDVIGVEARDGRVSAVTSLGPQGQTSRFSGDYFFSTTSVQELVRGMGESVPAGVRAVAEGLQFRDFIAVGLLLKQLKLRDPGAPLGKLISDNWIYIQEPDVLVGRLQIFNNWSPYLVSDPTKVWLGAEYFCLEGDELWRKPDPELAQFVIEELEKIAVIDRSEVIDWAVARMPKAYPAYFGLYERFEEVRSYLDGFENLFLIGRNGMHKYNNSDHSMLTAMTAVDNLLAGRTDKSNIWAVNTEEEYHETRAPAKSEPDAA